MPSVGGVEAHATLTAAARDGLEAGPHTLEYGVGTTESARPPVDVVMMDMRRVDPHERGTRDATDTDPLRREADANVLPCA